MVSAGVPPPVIQSVAEACAIHAAARLARSSVTVTVPRAPSILPPGNPALVLRTTEAGAVIDRMPMVTEKVTVVATLGSLPDGGCETASTPGVSGAADAAAGASAMPRTAAALR